MDPDEFLVIAGESATGARQGDWRTAASRAYYAAFHVARNLLRGAGFAVPAAHLAHNYLDARLLNSGHPDVQAAAGLFHRLRRWRNEADYDLHLVFSEERGVRSVNQALDVVRTLRDLQNEPTVLAQVVDAIRDYEHDIGEETWHAP